MREGSSLLQLRLLALLYLLTCHCPPDRILVEDSTICRSACTRYVFTFGSDAAYLVCGGPGVPPSLAKYGTIMTKPFGVMLWHAKLRIGWQCMSNYIILIRRLQSHYLNLPLGLHSAKAQVLHLVRLSVGRGTWDAVWRLAQFVYTLR